MESASLLLRIAGDKLVSVDLEIRLLFYLGVLLTAAGAGLLVQQNYQHIGPLAIAIALGIAALTLLGWAARHAPPFSWAEAPSPSLEFDYLLLLGVLLGAADLAFVEVQFTPLGSNWLWHLLIVSALMACAATRYDSRTVFSLALSTFAAWRGLSVSFLEKPLWHAYDDSVRLNALGCGLLFVLLGRYLLRGRRKPHFEPVAVHLGWLLILGALVSGGPEHGAKGMAYVVLLAMSGLWLARYCFLGRRFALFAFGVLAVYIALAQLVFKASLDSTLELLWITLSALALIAWLWKVQKKMKEPV